ncbi:MAG: Glu/Leu/Phe/Val dehydrogenase dimerization domain-containing protein [Planctomycetota bacterium]
MIKLKKLPVRGYEQVVVGKDAATGLHAICSVHSTVLGPSLGGVRMWPYKKEKDALEDVLRLSRAMTHKACISNLKLGGGKTVIVGNPAKHKTRDLLLAVGDLVESLGGAYIAAEDSGISSRDLDVIGERTLHLTGMSPEKGGSGDPALATAPGVFFGIKAAVKTAFGQNSVKGMTIAIQGVGQVGGKLARLLAKDGARLVIGDIDRERCKSIAAETGARIARADEIHKVGADLYAPCALSFALNAKTIPEIRAKVVAGGANNQFRDEKTDPVALHKRGILHAPDYVINAGGLIRLYVLELINEKDEKPWLEKIGRTLEKIWARAKREKCPPLFVAHAIVREKLAAAKAKKKKR